jgi:DMSO/TMAO reductase YedYZ molybdopterin-dependent catalytic subunit
MTLSRREFLAASAAGGLVAVLPGCRREPAGAGIVKPAPPALFVVRGATNAEARLDALPPELITPSAQFFVRSHEGTPVIDAAAWSLTIDGDAVQRPYTLTYDELLALPEATMIRFIDCAGNGRAFYEELLGAKTKGDPWRLGAYGVAAWTGVPLLHLLRRAGLRDGAAWVTPVGLDDGNFSRPMPLATAMRDDTLLAHRMNGEPLPPDHGFPARVVVSGWIGAASVKWVGRIEVTRERPEVDAVTKEYVLLGDDYERPPPMLTTTVIKSAVALPWPAALQAGRQTVHGFAWSPYGRIARVEVSRDGGLTWQPARLVGDNIAAAGTRWQFTFDAVPGDMSLTPRAFDEHGHGQPPLRAQRPNDHGYLFAAPVPHPVRVV